MQYKDIIKCKYLLIFCSYNRVEKTLNFLNSLLPQIDLIGISYKICMLDDKSIDSTKYLIQKRFQSIEIIDGNGNLFWAGGMRVLFDYASKKYDFENLIVMNDDIVLQDNKLKPIIEEYEKLNLKKENKCVLSASFIDKRTLTNSYSGYIRKSFHPLAFKKVCSNGKPLEVDALNMNFTLIPKKIIEKNGFLSKHYQHSKADLDYSIQIKKNGNYLFISSFPLGYCDINQKINEFEMLNSPKFLDNFRNPKGISFIEMDYFYSRNGKKLWQFFLIMSYLKYILIFILKKIYNINNKNK